MNTFYAPEKELPSHLLLPTHTNGTNHTTTRRAGFLSARFSALRAYFTLEGTYDAVTRCVRIVTQLTQIVSLGFILVWVMKVGAEAVLGVGDNEAINPIPALYLAGSIAVLQVAQMMFAGLETLEEYTRVLRYMLEQSSSESDDEEVDEEDYEV
ncbi:hypothetical protein V495_03621 [Pseudogymnoascus sp. VKM F-4514 (FW-929)]|nr:hypothetical protein V490_03456 [Pseudogymnoascus sp. VKM F-3557]KFY44139.1 hypothetical protein V495_03621 [Pseudogymnoascus sp. VKM F-4514 (FW-929)]KFY66445.1 hypothetical protein V497_00901 [Pseudogymnoascus sp. VKM F-4516 (FW-969)]